MTNWARGLVFCVLIAGVCASGCRPLDSTRPEAPGVREAEAQQVGMGDVVAIDSPIEIRLHENLTPNGRPLELRCATKRFYSIGGYTLLTDVRYERNLVKIEFTGIRVPEGGTTFPRPASTIVPLDPVLGHTFGFQFRVNGEVVPVRLRVTADSFAVSHGEGRWIVFPQTVLHRVPPGTIWGQIDWGPSDQSARAEAALDSLLSIGARPKRLIPGDYGYFRISGTGAIEPLPNGSYFARSFLFEYAGNRDVLAGVVRAFAGPVGFYVYDDLGQHWYGYRRSGQTIHVPRGTSSLANPLPSNLPRLSEGPVGDSCSALGGSPGVR